MRWNYLLIIFATCLVKQGSDSSAEAGQHSCPLFWEQVGQYCYKLMEDYDYYQKHCKDLGGRLPEFPKKEQMDHLKSTGLLTSGKFVFIGLKTSNLAGTTKPLESWKWVSSGLNLSYGDKWYSGEPNNQGNRPQMCGIICLSKNKIEFRDIHCHDSSVPNSNIILCQRDREKNGICPIGWMSDAQQFCYRKFDRKYKKEKSNFVESEDLCKGLDAHLPQFSVPGSYDQFRDEFTALNEELYVAFFLGAERLPGSSDSDPNGFAWLTDGVFDATEPYWDAGEPNLHTNENCVSNRFDAKWNDDKCSIKNRIVCQIEWLTITTALLENYSTSTTIEFNGKTTVDITTGFSSQSFTTTTKDGNEASLIDTTSFFLYRFTTSATSWHESISYDPISPFSGNRFGSTTSENKTSSTQISTTISNINLILSFHTTTPSVLYLISPTAFKHETITIDAVTSTASDGKKATATIVTNAKTDAITKTTVVTATTTEAITISTSCEATTAINNIILATTTESITIATSKQTTTSISDTISATERIKISTSDATTTATSDTVFSKTTEGITTSTRDKTTMAINDTISATTTEVIISSTDDETTTAISDTISVTEGINTSTDDETTTAVSDTTCTTEGRKTATSYETTTAINDTISATTTEIKTTTTSDETTTAVGYTISATTTEGLTASTSEDTTTEMSDNISATTTHANETSKTESITTATTDALYITINDSIITITADAITINISGAKTFASTDAIFCTATSEVIAETTDVITASPTDSITASTNDAIITTTKSILIITTINTMTIATTDEIFVPTYDTIPSTTVDAITAATNDAIMATIFGVVTITATDSLTATVKYAINPIISYAKTVESTIINIATTDDKITYKTIDAITAAKPGEIYTTIFDAITSTATDSITSIPNYVITATTTDQITTPITESITSIKKLAETPKLNGAIIATISKTVTATTTNAITVKIKDAITATTANNVVTFIKSDDVISPTTTFSVTATVGLSATTTDDASSFSTRSILASMLYEEVLTSAEATVLFFENFHTTATKTTERTQATSFSETISAAVNIVTASFYETISTTIHEDAEFSTLQQSKNIDYSENYVDDHSQSMLLQLHSSNGYHLKQLEGTIVELHPYTSMSSNPVSTDKSTIASYIKSSTSASTKQEHKQTKLSSTVTTKKTGRLNDNHKTSLRQAAQFLVTKSQSLSSVASISAENEKIGVSRNSDDQSNDDSDSNNSDTKFENFQKFILKNSFVPRKRTEIANVVEKQYPAPLAGAAAIAATVMHSLGYIWLIGIICGTMLIAFILRLFGFLRLLHLIQEIGLLFACVVLLLAKNIESEHSCRLASALTNLFYVLWAVFCLIEAIYVLCLLSNVINNSRGFPRTLSILFGIGATCILAAVSLPGILRGSINPSCWMNWSSQYCVVTQAATIFAITFASVVIAESGASFYRSPLPLSNMDERGSALPCILGLVVKALLGMSSYILGSMALYFQQIGLFVVVFGLNIALGVAIFVFHVLADAEMKAMAIAGYQRIRRTARN